MCCYYSHTAERIGGHITRIPLMARVRSENVFKSVHLACLRARAAVRLRLGRLLALPALQLYGRRF